MRARWIVAAVAVVGAVAAVAAVAPGPASIPASAAVTVKKGSANLTLPCGLFGGTTTVAADWYFPAGAPTAVVWLQHGFSRNKGNVAGLAQAIAAETGAAVVAPTVSSNFLSLSGCWINGTNMHRAVARMFGDRFASLQSSANTAASAAGAGSVTLPRAFVLAGHSAGGNLATSAAGFTTQLTTGGSGTPLVVSHLMGVVLLDGVDNGGAIGTGLDRLTGANARPVRTVAAPDSSCNASGSGTKLLQQKRPGQFVGVRLTGGTHVDAEGENASSLSITTCGRPLTANVAALRHLAAGWVNQYLGQAPAGAFLDTTTAGTVSTLPSGATATTL